MSREKIELDHPMSAGNKRTSRKEFSDSANEVFEKLDSGELSAKTDEREEPVKPSNVKSIRELLFFGNITHTFEIEGFHFRMKSLSNKDSREIAKRLFLMSNEEKLVEANILHAACAIDLINEMTPSEAYSEIFQRDPSDKSDLDLNLEILSEMSTFFVGKIINEYFVISEKSSKMVSSGSEEVVEDVKK